MKRSNSSNSPSKNSVSGNGLRDHLLQHGAAIKKAEAATSLRLGRKFGFNLDKNDDLDKFEDILNILKLSTSLESILECGLALVRLAPEKKELIAIEIAAALNALPQNGSAASSSSISSNADADGPAVQQVGAITLARFLMAIEPPKRKEVMFQMTKDALDLANQDLNLLKSELTELISEKRIQKWADRDKSMEAKEFLSVNWGRFVDAGIVTVGLLRAYDAGFYSHLTRSAKDVYALIPTISDQNDLEVSLLELLGYPPRELVRLAANANQKL